MVWLWNRDWLIDCFIKHRPTLLDSFGHSVKHRPTLFHPTMWDDVLRCFTRLDGALDLRQSKTKARNVSSINLHGVQHTHINFQLIQLIVFHCAQTELVGTSRKHSKHFTSSKLWTFYFENISMLENWKKKLWKLDFTTFSATIFPKEVQVFRWKIVQLNESFTLISRPICSVPPVLASICHRSRHVLFPTDSRAGFVAGCTWQMCQIWRWSDVDHGTRGGVIHSQRCSAVRVSLSPRVYWKENPCMRGWIARVKQAQAKSQFWANPH